MTNLKEKNIQWLGKLRQGDKKFCGIVPTEDGFRFVSGKHVERVDALKIVIDRENGLYPEFNYDVAHPAQGNLQASIIIKDDCKMIISDANGEYGFGVSDTESKVNAVFIYVRKGPVHTLIFGSKKAQSVNVIYGLATEPYDAVAHCLDDVFTVSMPPSAPTMNGEVDYYG